jgi:capsular polysaccharide biosynthesis protein
VEIRRYLMMLRRRAVLIALVMAAAVAAAFGTADRSSTYLATSTIYVGARSFDLETGRDSNLSGDRAAGVERLIATFATMIDSETIAQQALETTGEARSATGVVAATTAAPILDTNMLAVYVQDSNPAVAQALSTAMAESFISRIRDLEPGGTVGEGELPSAQAAIFERAKLPTIPQTQPVISSLIVAALFGFLFAAGGVLLVEYLDITVQTGADAERRLELPVLGVIPLFEHDVPEVGARAAPRHDAVPELTHRG